jgi:gamma-soluble NSF attachment protein
MQSQKAKEDEADSYMKSGKKHLEKSLFHLKANYDGAAEDFEKAARIYTNTCNYPKALDAWTRASQANAKAHNDFNAANAMERLGDFISQYMAESNNSVYSGATGATTQSFDLPMFKEGIKAYEEASRLYGVATNGQKQAGALKKAVDLVSRSLTASQRQQQQKAGPIVNSSAAAANITFLQGEYTRLVPQVIELMQRNWEATESRPFELPDVYRGYILFNLRAGNIEGAVQVEKRMIGVVSTSPADGTYDDGKNLFRILNQPTNAAKAGLEIIVLCLSTSVDDGYTWANIEMGRLGGVFGFCGSQEEQTAAALLAAYAERDEEALQEVLKTHPCFNFLVADISRLAKKLTMGAKARPKAVSGAASPTPASASGIAASPNAGRADLSETDEDDLR